MPIKSRIRTVHHYPKRGGMFCDITTLLKHPVGSSVNIHQCTAQGISVRNPSFDVAPTDLVNGLITENGLVHQPNRGKVEAFSFE